MTQSHSRDQAPSHQPKIGWWRSFCLRLRFKLYLPYVQRIRINTVTLDVVGYSAIIKNRLLMGNYEKDECELVARELGPDDYVLELGGAIGFLGLFARNVVKVGRWASVEANPHTLELLRRNYQANGLAPEVIHAAFNDVDGQVELDVSGLFWSNSTVGQPPTAQSSTVTVEARSLKSLLAAIDFTPTALVIDIEGAERLITPDDIPAAVNTIIMEIHPQMIGVEAVEALLQGLARIGLPERQRIGDVVLLRR